MTVSNPDYSKSVDMDTTHFNCSNSMPAHANTRKGSEAESSVNGSAGDITVPSIFLNDRTTNSRPVFNLNNNDDNKLFLPPCNMVSVSPMVSQFCHLNPTSNDVNMPLLPPNTIPMSSLSPRENLTRTPSIRTEGKRKQETLQLELSRAKLKATSRTSALLAGFAMVAIVELDLSPLKMSGGSDSTPHLALIIFFGVCTTLLVSVHLLALMMSTCILPHLDSSYIAQDGPSPHLKLQWYIETSWLFSTCFGLMLFLLEIGIVFWIKFIPLGYDPAAYVTTALLVPVFIIFILFTMTFYKTLMRHKVDKVKDKLDELQRIYGTPQGLQVV